MKVLVIGAGGVGTRFRPDRRPPQQLREGGDRRLRSGSGRRGRPIGLRAFSGVALDASDEAAIVDLIAAEAVDAVLNAVDPRFVMPVYRPPSVPACTYMDMAMSLSHPDPDQPHAKTGVKLGDEQFELAAQWEERGQLALVGMGVEPGLSDIFARHASDRLFSSIDEIGVRDGSNLVVDGYAFCPTFSIWTTIEECLNPPVIWEKDRGWFTTEPFSEPETFRFPAGIGPVECVNVEHEEVLLIPRWVDAQRVTFKYGLGDEFIAVLKTIHMLGLDSTDEVAVGDARVSPRDVVAACLPDPAEIGDRMHGLTCAGTWVDRHRHRRARREVYLYHVVDNDWCMAEYGSQAVVWQTAVNPVLALELIAAGAWSGVGLLGPEALPPGTLPRTARPSGAPWGFEERTPS